MIHLSQTSFGGFVHFIVAGVAFLYVMGLTAAVCLQLEGFSLLLLILDCTHTKILPMSDVEAALGRVNSSYCRDEHFFASRQEKAGDTFPELKVQNLNTMKAVVESLLVLPLTAVRVACGQLTLSLCLPLSRKHTSMNTLDAQDDQSPAVRHREVYLRTDRKALQEQTQQEVPAEGKCIKASDLQL